MQKKIRVLIAAAILLLPLNAKSWDLVELGDIEVEHKSFVSNKNPYAPSGGFSSEINLDLNLTIFSSSYLKNRVHSQTEAGYYRLVGWNWETGLKVTSYLEVGWWHFSRHLLDNKSLTFPTGWSEDGLIIRIKLNKGVSPEPML
jgi:hypothetical protein